jgi:hypothetical protein
MAILGAVSGLPGETAGTTSCLDMAKFLGARRRKASSAPRILLLIRDRKANTWEEICTEFALDPNDYHTGHSMVWEEIEALRDAGLIEFRTQGETIWEQPNIDGPIQVTAAWERIQQALGISLAQIAELDKHDDLVVRPFFERPADVELKRDLFVLMPFSESLRAVYNDHIKKVASELKLTVARADDFFSARSVMTDVWSGIFFARAIIADCTGRNPNVFYEIGLAHVLGKPVVLITQNADDVPFDVRHIRVIQYTFTPRGMADFERALSETIKSTLSIR